MKHAVSTALDHLEPLLKELRRVPLLTEKSRGRFYRGSRAFLHFHVDGEEFYADVRLAEDFERFPATTQAHHKALVRLVAKAVGDGKPAPARSKTSGRATRKA